MKYLLLFLCALIQTRSFAQELSFRTPMNHGGMRPIDSQSALTAMVYIYENRPGQIRFWGSLGLAAETTSGDAIKGVLRVEGDIFLKKSLSFHGSYGNAFYDVETQQTVDKGNNNKAENKVPLPRFFDLGGRIYLKRFNTRTKQKLVLNRWRAQTREGYAENYLLPKLPALGIVTLRCGYYGNSTVVNTDMNKDELTKGDDGAVKTKDGTVLAGRYYSNAISRGGYLGIGKLSLTNLLTRNTYRQEKLYRSMDIKEIYGDILFAITDVDPIIANGFSHEIVTNDAGSFQASKIGGRIGISHITRVKGITIGRKLEAGYRPGITGTGWYLNFFFSFGLMR